MMAVLRGILLLVFISLTACGGGDGSDAENNSKWFDAEYRGGLMPAGFSVMGDTGVLQIDQEYSNYLLASKGSSFVNNSGATISIGNSVAPVLCLRPSGGKVVVDKMTYVRGGTTQWTLRTSWWPAESATVDWFIFDAGAALPDSGPGISVYDANGRLTYNSNASEMRVKGVLTTPSDLDPYSGWVPDVVQSVPPNVAVCITSAKARLFSDGNNTPSLTLVEGVSFDGTSISTGYSYLRAGPILPETLVLNGEQTQIILIDIAGL